MYKIATSRIKAIIAFLASVSIAFYIAAGSAIAAEGDLQTGWRFDRVLFPSFLIANSTRKQPAKTQRNFIGDSWGSVGVSVISPRDEARVRLELTIDNISDSSSMEVTLARAGERYFLSPNVRYRFMELSRIRQPISVNANFILFVDGAKVGEQTQTIRVRSINDIPFARVGKDGKYIDYSWMFAAYVNENHPQIDQELRRVLDIPVPIVHEFVGYQRGSQEVINQVFAIWYYFQRSGFTYSSITTPTGFTEGVYSQYVRTLEDSLRTAQSNCIDGTVLFASILRRIGIDPFIILVPGHAYLGFYLDQQHRSAAYLETTVMNTQLNPYRQQRPSRLSDGIARAFKYDDRMRLAADSFNYALTKAHENYAKAQSKIKANAPGYRVIDIEKIRRDGINPINR